ncbi:hypothetical protein U1769_15855 [Sphingomonas sp. ZT3P38]|uniref:hypothetical protein n=1 Tax=Parasphingomonas zepuensis TaxID=3096161 RepID=UPI002FC5B614
MNGSPGDALPNFVVGPGSKQAFNDRRGVVRDRAPAALAARNIRFTDDGKGIIQFDPGQFVSASQIGPRQGGDGVSTYDVAGGFRLRGSRSRDIRAASFRELFLKNVPTEPGSTSGIVDNPAIPGSAGGDDPTPILGGGSFALTPEKADTTTLGAVFAPRFLRNLKLSADWY